MDQETKAGLKEAGRALLIAVAIVGALAALFWLSSCAAWHEHPTEVRVFAEVDPWGSPFGRNPSGHILLTQPLPGYFELNAQHISSIPDFHDRAVLNAAGIGVCVRIPLEKCQ